MSDILDRLKQLNDQRGDEVEAWFSRQRAKAAPFFYNSVDLRHSGLKLAPVDTNLYPAGFNNLSPRARARASRFIGRALQDQWPQARRVLIVPENHTRNMGYLENLATLLALFEAAGLEVRIGSLVAESGQPVLLEAPGGRHLRQEPMRRRGNALELEDGYVPDLIILNHDMTSGPAAILQGLSQPVAPPVELGWYRRRKTVHFAAYRALVDDFAAVFGMDGWQLAAEFHCCGFVDFKERTGLDCVANGVEKVLARVREKYAQYGIKDEPYAFIKADSGTYGMGIMTVRGGEEVLELNKKDRNKMQVIKEGTQNHEVIIQEGVPTIDRISGGAAEPMVYMVDGVPIGGMYRVNDQRDAQNNLNAAGMRFTGMCDEVEQECSSFTTVQECHFAAYGIVAAIAALAVAREDYSEAGQKKTELACG